MGNHLTNSTFLEETQIPVSGLCYARNEYVMQCFFQSSENAKDRIYILGKGVGSDDKFSFWPIKKVKD